MTQEQYIWLAIAVLLVFIIWQMSSPKAAFNLPLKKRFEPSLYTKPTVRYPSVEQLAMKETQSLKNAVAERSRMFGDSIVSPDEALRIHGTNYADTVKSSFITPERIKSHLDYVRNNKPFTAVPQNVDSFEEENYLNYRGSYTYRKPQTVGSLGIATQLTEVGPENISVQSRPRFI